MKNPDKYIRAAYIAALTSATGLPVFDKGIPLPDTLPTSYYILGTQTKTPKAISKSGWEWSCTAEVHCVYVNDKGFNSSAKVDDMEEAVLSVGKNLSVTGFKPPANTFVDSVDSDMETQTNTINRKVVIYEHWLNAENA